jgi:hypothetical protein
MRPFQRLTGLTIKHLTSKSKLKIVNAPVTGTETEQPYEGTKRNETAMHPI